MPIPALPEGCVALYANIAENTDVSVNETLSCSQNTGSVVLSNVQVTGTQVGAASFSKIDDQTVEVTVPITIYYSFHGTSDGFEFDGTDSCQQNHTFQLTVTSAPSAVYDADCSANLSATATAGVFDDINMVQPFDVTLTGNVTSTIYTPQIVIVETPEQ